MAIRSTNTCGYDLQKQTAKRSGKNRKLKLLLSDKEKLEEDLTATAEVLDNQGNETKLKRRKLKNVEDDLVIKILNDERKIDDSFEVAKQLFQWMISPIPLDTFFR